MKSCKKAQNQYKGTKLIAYIWVICGDMLVKNKAQGACSVFSWQLPWWSYVAPIYKPFSCSDDQQWRGRSFVQWWWYQVKHEKEVGLLICQCSKTKTEDKGLVWPCKAHNDLILVHHRDLEECCWGLQWAASSLLKCSLLQWASEMWLLIVLQLPPWFSGTPHAQCPQCPICPPVPLHPFGHRMGPQEKMGNTVWRCDMKMFQMNLMLSW